MPELPEVEAVCRKLRRAVKGREIVAACIARPRIAAPQDAAAIETAVAGRVIHNVERRGKNILIALDDGNAVHVHLRMTGNLYAIPDVRFRPASARAWFELAGGQAIVFEDSRALGRLHLLDEGKVRKLQAAVGPEPLSRAFTAEAFAAMARPSRQPAKLFLMDQQRVAGLGNIYAAEALFRAKIHPRRPMHRLSPARLAALHGAIVSVLRDAVQSACTAYSRPGQRTEAESFPVAVYSREGESCDVCGSIIRRIAQGGRSTYYCPGCQR